MVDAYNRNIYASGTVAYSDIDLSFKTNPVTGDIRKKINLEAVKQSLKTVLFMNRGEKPFQPEIHGGLNDLLFEPLDEVTTGVLEDQIKTVIANYEPRISVIDLKVVGEPDEHSLEVSLTFSMVNVIEPQTINIILKRIR